MCSESLHQWAQRVDPLLEKLWLGDTPGAGTLKWGLKSPPNRGPQGRVLHLSLALLAASMSGSRKPTGTLHL